MEKKVFYFCEKKYNEVFSIVQKNLIRATKRKLVDLSEQKQNEIENNAQLEAIKVTMIDGISAFPNEVPLLWASIYKAHLYRKSGIKNPKIVELAIQAEQSWRFSSGHAFESMVK